MSTRPTPPTGGADPSVILSATRVGPQKQYFTYKGETYMVQAMQRNPATGEFDEDITPMRDWTTAGIHAMEAADKVFQKERVNLAEVKTVHVPLTGTVATSPTAPTHAAPVTIGSEIRYSRSITNSPETHISIEADTRALLHEEIGKIGRETAVWKDPTRLYQRAEQSGTSAPGIDTPSPSSTPTETPPITDSTAAITLPPLTFTGPAPYAHNREAALSSFLKSQQTSGATTPINSTQQRLSATSAISAQLAQFTPAVNHTPEDLQKGAATRIAEHLSDFANNPTDSEEMFTALKTRYDASTADLPGLKALLKDGAARSTKLDDRNYSTLELCLANKNASQLTSDEKILVAKAFANLIYKTPPADNQSYPKVYFKAMHAFYDMEKVGTTLRVFGGTEQGSGKSLVIVERTPAGDYKIWGRWPDSGTLRPDRTAFVLYESTEMGGKFSGFSRTTGMDARDPLEPALPQTGVATRPAYYSDRQDIETGGGGNCGAFALADAILQKQETYYRTESDWKAALGQQKVGIRNDAMRHLFDRAEDFTTDQLFPEVLNSIHESGNEIILQQPQHASTLSQLLRKSPGTLLPAEKKWLVQLYAVYATNEGKDLDKPFFLAHAARTGQKIAIIRNNEIIFTAPPAGEAITADGYLFVHYDGANHFRSVNRNYTTPSGTVAAPGSPYLDQIISGYNTDNTSQFARRAFLNSFANPSTIQANLNALKASDPHGYLTLQEIAGADIVNNAAKGTDVPGFITALESAAGVAANQPALLATAVERQFNTRTDLKARAQFLSALIEAKTETPPPVTGSAAQLKLIADLRTLRTEDMAGYLSLKTRIPGFDFDAVDNGTDMTNLIGINLDISTTLAGTEPTTVPGLFATDELRLKEIATRKSSMMIEGGQGIAGILKDPSNSHLEARAEFFQALMKAPTGALSTERAQELGQELNELSNELSTKDPNGYFAFKAFQASRRDISSWQTLVANRNAAMTAILNSADDARVKAQADVIKAVKMNDVSAIGTAVQHLKDHYPQDYLALETLFPEGDLPPDQMSLKLQAIMTRPESVKKLPIMFANSIHAPATQGLFTFIGAFELYQHQIQEGERLSTGIPSSGNYNPTYRGANGLQGLDPAAFLAIEDLHLKRTDHPEAVNASMYAVQYKSTADIKKAIAVSRNAMTARANFLVALKAAKSPVVATEPQARLQEQQQKHTALTDAINKIQQFDIHGGLGLVEITKKTNSHEIATKLLDDPRSFEDIEKIFVPNLTGVDEHRPVYTPPLTETIYSPALVARANLMQAAMIEPHAITPELWQAVTENDVLGALVLGKLIYEIDKAETGKIPSDTDTSTSTAQLAYGMGQIQAHPERIAEILPKMSSFVQLLATQKANGDANDLEPIVT